jgi:hypothetical protein
VEICDWHTSDSIAEESDVDEASNSSILRSTPPRKPVIYSVTWNPEKPEKYCLTVKTPAGERIEEFDNWSEALLRAVRLR